MHRPIVPPHEPPPRLLLVDDDPILRETLADLLLVEGFKVTAAANGEEAERILESAQPPFDLVLTDLVMPGKDGMDVLRCALKVHPSATVLILSGFGSVREATMAVAQGAYGMLTKPLQIESFRQTLARILERSRLLAERDALKLQVQALETKVDSLETTLGRMEILAQRLSPASPEATPPSSLAQLERLAELQSRGLLTREQFETVKQAVLARWTP